MASTAVRHDWERIRAAYEAGVSMDELSRQYGVVRATISRRARKEAWVADFSAAVNRRAKARQSGLVSTADPGKTAEAVANAADKKAAVMQQHRKAWPEIRELHARAVAEQDIELAKLAKVAAEVEKIIQEGERRAWGIQDKPEAEISGGLRITWQE